MRAFWPQSLAGRLIIWLMLVLGLALITALLIQRNSNERLLAQMAKEDAVTRATMLSRILDQGGQDQWNETLHAATSKDLRFSIRENVFEFDKNKEKRKITVTSSTTMPVKSLKNRPPFPPQGLRRVLRRNQNVETGKRLLVIERASKRALNISRKKDARPSFDLGYQTITIDDVGEIPKERVPHLLSGKESISSFFLPAPPPLPPLAIKSFDIDAPAEENQTIDMVIKLDDGRWLNAAYMPQALPLWTGNSLLFLGLLAVAIGGVIILVIRHETRPMQRLAASAEALGRGEHMPPLDENGPFEVRTAVKAFNVMGSRLARYMQDRTRMLAAMSHDLRTPLTTLRLRAEMIDEPETREKLIETIEEMHRITQASLSFAREEDDSENTENIDLNAFLLELCDEANSMGKDACLQDGTPPIMARIRPAAMRRAVRNLIDNAVRYGKCARLSLQQSKSAIRIIIDDDGPGIDETQLGDVFSPFVRLENSRNTDTGGTGLGLSIARTIARSHGGDVVLENRKDGGLRAILSVPGGTG